MSVMVDGTYFRSPCDLRVTPSKLNRVLVIGQCALVGWGGEIERQVPGAKSDYVLFNHAAQLPDSPPHPASEYDFQLIQIPMRSVLPESAVV